MDMIDTDINDEFDDEQVKSGAGLRVAMAGLIVLALVIGGVWWLGGRNHSANSATITLETARSAYLATLSETHTGRRLARLDDFLSQFPNNEAHAAARIRRDALWTHEQSAWANFTKARYDLDLTDADKAEALAAYQSIWGNFTRKAEIGSLAASLTDDDILSFQKPKSKYAKAGDVAMVGENENTARTIPPPTTSITQSASRTAQPAPAKLRIRSDRTPVYPKKAKRRGVEAVVTLALDIDDRGKVRRTHIVRVDAPKYHKDFTKAAQRAARRTRFYPMEQGGTPVPVQGYRRTYRFEIDG